MPFGTKITYKGYTLKSKVEFAWAQYFEAEGFDWEYEPVRFRDPGAPEGKGYTYTPDFGLDRRTFFIETKTWGASNVENRFHFCLLPLLIIFGLPEKHYIRIKPAGEAHFLTPRYKTFAQAYALARKVAA